MVLQPSEHIRDGVVVLFRDKVQGDFGWTTQEFFDNPTHAKFMAKYREEVERLPLLEAVELLGIYNKLSGVNK